MRERMRKELSRATEGQFDIKQDTGGVADIEFLAQYWALKWAKDYPPVALFSDTIRQLESVASADLVPQVTVDLLIVAYQAYRATYDIARHYRNEVLPLRKIISDETLLRYNAMQIDVFALLAEARLRITSTTAAASKPLSRSSRYISEPCISEMPARRCSLRRTAISASRSDAAKSAASSRACTRVPPAPAHSQHSRGLGRDRDGATDLGQRARSRR